MAIDLNVHKSIGYGFSSVKKIIHRIPGTIESLARNAFRAITETYYRVLCRNRLKASEYDTFSDFGKALKGENISDASRRKCQSIVDKILDEDKYKRKVRNTVYLADRHHKVKNEIPQTGLEALRLISDLSHKVKELKEFQNLDQLKRKTRTLTSTQEKFTLRELYLLYTADRIQSEYNHLNNTGLLRETSAFKGFIEENRDFLSHASEVVKEVWKRENFSNRTIILLNEDKFLSARAKSYPVFSGLRRLIRGNKLHSGMVLKAKEDDQALQSHVMYSHYAKTPIRFIELIASDFYTLDAQNFLKPQHMVYLREIYKGKSDEQIIEAVNDEWNNVLAELQSEDQNLEHIRNSTPRKVLSVLSVKRDFAEKPPGEIDLSQLNKATCSEFVVLLIKKSVYELNQKLRAKYFDECHVKLELSGDFITCPVAAERASVGFTPAAIGKHLDSFMKPEKGSIEKISTA